MTPSKRAARFGVRVRLCGQGLRFRSPRLMLVFLAVCDPSVSAGAQSAPLSVVSAVRHHGSGVSFLGPCTQMQGRGSCPQGHVPIFRLQACSGQDGVPAPQIIGENEGFSACASHYGADRGVPVPQIMGWIVEVISILADFTWMFKEFWAPVSDTGAGELTQVMSSCKLVLRVCLHAYDDVDIDTHNA